MTLTNVSGRAAQDIATMAIGLTGWIDAAARPTALRVIAERLIAEAEKLEGERPRDA